MGIDTSSKGIALSVKNPCGSEILISRHSKRAGGEDVVLIMEKALKSLNMKAQNIHRAAIVTGPGSFTGLRVGMAFLKAFYLGTKIEIKGINTLYALAWKHRKISEYILSVREARAGEFYCGFFKNSKTGLAPIFLTESLKIDSLKEKIVTKEFVVAGDIDNKISSFLNESGYIASPVGEGQFEELASSLFELWDNPYTKILEASSMVPDYINPSPAGV